MIIIAQIENNSQLANELLKTKNYLKASQLYNNLYNTHKSTNYYQNLLDCYLGLNKITEAEKLVKKHSKKDYNNPSILVDYAHIYMLKQEFRNV